GRDRQVAQGCTRDGPAGVTSTQPRDAGTIVYGIRPNLSQFVHQLVQVLLVGLALGMMRTVVPALAETEFGVARGSMLLLGTFVVAFGIVKAVLNFVAGRLSERVGRRRVLLLGWIAALPVPFAPADQRGVTIGL